MVECTYFYIKTNEQQIRAFKTKNIAVFQNSELDRIFIEELQKLCDEEVTYLMKRSGWSLSSIDGILLRINRYQPLKCIHISRFIFKCT